MILNAEGVLTGYDFIVPDGQKIDIRFTIIRTDKDDDTTRILHQLIRNQGKIKIILELKEEMT